MRVRDGAPTDARLPETGVRAVFGPAARQQRYLDVEAALAAAQAECGVIPQDAADAIVTGARLERLDPARLAGTLARTGHSMMPVIDELSRVVGEPHGGWVHWGATTQNIQQTADVLGIREVHGTLTDLVVDVLCLLADLADEHATTVMAGRTHAQQAVPITFGFKVAAWIDPLLRHLERWEQLAERAFTAMAGGAVGTFAAMGPRGPAVQEAFARRLGLRAVPVASRSIADPFAELVCVLAMLSATGSGIAEEVSRLSAVEFGELEEALPPGDVGSSTMPQKRNAKLCLETVTIGAQTRALVPLALEAMIHSHEVDAARTVMMDEAVEQVLILTGDGLVRLREVVRGLRVHVDRMRRNLDLSGGAVMAESVMMGLADATGRQQAHGIVHHAAAIAASTGRSFADALFDDTTVVARLGRAEIEMLLDPAAHVGASATIARDTAQRARLAAGHGCR